MRTYRRPRRRGHARSDRIENRHDARGTSGSLTWDCGKELTQHVQLKTVPGIAACSRGLVSTLRSADLGARGHWQPRCRPGCVPRRRWRNGCRGRCRQTGPQCQERPVGRDPRRASTRARRAGCSARRCSTGGASDGFACREGVLISRTKAIKRTQEPDRGRA